ncbi:MAG: LysR family transcriptional regulator [Ruminococcaceae bacterium]|nr:LysR family transcriptional regulator [Oscillospiraceae bacterium]
MTLDQLRYFQAACQFSSISRAARALNISQPSVSTAISKLEDEFGVALFTRQNKRLMLTKEGAVLLRHTTALLQEADNTAKRMRELRDTKVLNLGVPPMISAFLLPTLFGDFFRQYPYLKVNIIEGDRSTLVNMFEENRIHMAFLPHDGVLESGLASQLLAEMDIACCVGKEHPLAHRSCACIEDLRNEKLVLFQNSFFHTGRILDRFHQSGITPNVLMHTAQVSTVQSMVASGLAISFVFQFLPDGTENLVGIPLDPPMRTKVSLVWKQSDYLSDDMLRLIQFVKNTSG